MRLSCLLKLALALGCLLAAQARAPAAFVNWSYNWSRLPADVISSSASGTSKLTLTDEALGRGTNSSDIVATNIRTFSDAGRGDPNMFKDAAYALTLRLTDDASGESGALTFKGVFNGTLSATSADIQTTLVGETTQELVLGGNRYTVSVGDFSPPGPPGVNNAGSLGAHVEVLPADDPGGPPPPTTPPPTPPNDAPEPSTMLLAGLGLSSLGAAVWRKRKRRDAAA